MPFCEGVLCLVFYNECEACSLVYLMPYLMLFFIVNRSTNVFWRQHGPHHCVENLSK